jgi:transcription antitermination factor NusG
MVRALFIKASQPAARTRLGHVQTLCITALNSSPLRGYAFALCSDPALAVAELRNVAPTVRTLTHTAKGKKPGKPVFVPSVLTVKEWEKFLVEIENLEGWVQPGKMGVGTPVRVKEGALAGFSGMIRALEGDTATVEFTILNRPCIQTVAIDLLQPV